MAAIKGHPLKPWLQALALVAALPALCVSAHAQQAYESQQGSSSHDTAMKSLHDALHLTPQQEVAWANYATQTGTTSQASGRQQAAQSMMPTLEAPRRMDLIEAEMRQELADLHSRSEALKALYALLTPEQRRTFDQRTLPQQGER